MRAAETTHAVTLMVLIVLTGVMFAAGATELSGFLLLWNGLFNLLPVLLQRHNRARLSVAGARLTRMRGRSGPTSRSPP